MKKQHRYLALAGIVSTFTVCTAVGGTTQPTDSAPPASWSGSPGIVGHLGLSAGLNSVTDDDDDSADVWFGTVDGSITLPFYGPNLLVLDGYARYDDLSSDGDYDDDEDPEFEYSFGAHYLRQFTDDTRAGFFVSYGDTRAQDESAHDSYDVLMYGLEAHHFFSDQVMIFAQLGYGTKVRDAQSDDEGFDGGMIGRFGISYFPDQKSAFTLEFEAAGASDYIDGDDNGRFFGTTLSYQRQLTDDMPLYFTCFGRYDFIDATTEEDYVEEMQVGIGLRYYFGAGSPQEAARKGLSIGSPRLPVRASAYTEYLD